MGEVAPFGLGDELRRVLGGGRNDPHPVDKRVDGALTGGHAGTPDSFGRMDHRASVDNADDPGEGGDEASYDPDGLDVALQITSHLGGLPAPRARTKRRRRAWEDRAAGDLEPVGRMLDELVEERGWTTQIGLRLLLNRWPDLVGPDNAAHSRPEGFVDGVLRVRAESSTWATALRFIAPQVVARLNERLGDGAVRRIDVRGPAAPSWKHGLRSVRDGRGPRDTYG